MHIKRTEWELIDRGSFMGYRVEVEDEQGTTHIKTSRFLVPHYKAVVNAKAALRRLSKDIEKMAPQPL